MLGHACGMAPTGANIVLLKFEDRAYCAVKLRLAACWSWVGRWDDGGLGFLLLLAYCALFVVAIVDVVVVVVVVVSAVFGCLYLRLAARVGVLGHRGSTAVGHPCGMPPTGANIDVPFLKT